MVAYGHNRVTPCLSLGMTGAEDEVRGDTQKNPDSKLPGLDYLVLICKLG